jgi:hypothetical protein
LSTEDEEMREIYNDVILSIDSLNKKKGINTLGSFGKKSIPFIQELYDVETDEDVKNYMLETITQINKGTFAIIFLFVV